jgi:hypothetical protein
VSGRVSGRKERSLLPLTHSFPIDPEGVATIVYFDSSINVAPVEASLAIKLVALVPIVGVEPVAAKTREDDVGVVFVRTV